MTDTGIGATVFLAPPSPPSAPHLGTIYTLCLLDAAARTRRHLGGSALLPESWNLASRRLDEHLTKVPTDDRWGAYESAVAAAVTATRSILAEHGISVDSYPAVRDDHPPVQAEMSTAITELVDEGKILHLTVPEKWCDPCGIALPVTSTIETCFRCNGALATHERQDWFLALDFPAILQRAADSRWLPK